MSELDELADDVVFLLDGRARFVGAVPELLSRTKTTSLERAIVQTMSEPVVTEAAA
jgi:hypothetical protein